MEAGGGEGRRGHPQAEKGPPRSRMEGGMGCGWGTRTQGMSGSQDTLRFGATRSRGLTVPGKSLDDAMAF